MPSLKLLRRGFGREPFPKIPRGNFGNEVPELIEYRTQKCVKQFWEPKNVKKGPTFGNIGKGLTGRAERKNLPW